MRIRTKRFLLCLLLTMFLITMFTATGILVFADSSTTNVGGGTNPDRAAANIYSDGENKGELNGVYFSLPDGGDVSFATDWTVAYAAESESALQLKRGETIYSMGTQNGTVIKYGATDCYLKLEAWMLKDYTSYLPFKDGDVIVLNGVFFNSVNGQRFNVSRTLFEVSGDKFDGFSVNVIAEAEETVRLGEGKDIGRQPKENDEGVVGVYFGVENDDDIAVGATYSPIEQAAVSFKRNGTNRRYDAVSVVKTSAHEFLLDCSEFGISLPLRGGDVLTIDGIFENNNSCVRISKTYISISESNGNVVATVTTQDPSVIQAGKGSTDTRKPNIGADDGAIWGIYFDLEEGTKVPFDSGWNLGYAPQKSSNIRLYRNGEVLSLGKAGVSTLIKFSATEVYFKTEAWMLSNAEAALPLRDGDLIVLEGEFSANKNTFLLDETTIEITKVGRNEFQTVVINDFREKLITMINDDYPLANYDREEKKQVESIIFDTSKKIMVEKKAVNAYADYLNAVEYLEKISVSIETREALENVIKPNAISTLENYVDKNDYFENEQMQIDKIIKDGKVKINAAENEKEVVEALKNAEYELDSVKTKVYLMEKAIKEKSDGWEKYLEEYNVASLRDLNFGSALHFKKDGGNTESINTDERFNNVFNALIPSDRNTSGSMAFKFKYKNDGEQPYINFFMRGRQWCGFVFTIGTDSGGNGGYWAQRLEYDGCDTLFTANSGHTLKNGTEYEIELGVIDLKDTDRTWIYVKVDGEIGLSVFYDTISYAEGNYRITIKANVGGNSDYTLSDCNEELSELPVKKVGGFSIATGHTDGMNGIYATLEENEIPYAKDKSKAAYAVSEDAIVLYRNGVAVKNISTRTPCIKKYSVVDYFIGIAETGFNPTHGDELVIDGKFSYFVSDTNEKFAFYVSRCVFVFNNGVWEQKITLDNAKKAAADELDGYVDLSLYSEEDTQSIIDLLADAKLKIESAESSELVVKILTDTKSEINKVKTIFGKYVYDAVASVENYKNNEIGNYYDEEKSLIEEYKAIAIATINASTTTDQVDKAKAECFEKINKIKTKSEVLSDELSAAKEEGVQTIKDVYGKLDLSKLSDSEIVALNEETLSAIENIKNAVGKDDVNSLVSSYENKYGRNTGTNDKKGGCASAVTGYALCIPLLGFVAIMLIIKNKKRNIFGGK